MPAKTKFEVKLGAATREAFGRALVELGRENKDIVVCDADLSKSTMTSYFAKEFPDRFISCGIAEANMTAIGAGLAYAGKIPFVSSFSSFAMCKGFEQLRVCAAYPKLNLKVVGTHSGISIGEDGPSQMSVEETALACALPGFLVLSPADESSCKALVREAAAHFGPVFIRTGRVKAPIIYNGDQKFEIGKAIQVVEGKDVTIIANGLLVAQSILAAETLEGEGISARVLDMHTVKPLDLDAIRRAALETGAIVVAEEHLVDSGLGVRVAQAAAEMSPCAMEFVGIHDTYAESGQPDELLEKYGLVARGVAAAVRKVLARKRA
ncbi:MAG TPA: transketolase C-terminal domain-containing protein [Verrucomicrobiae bacterium]|nr:transketolase C-terminal domain-containing protein [Verrucomicrobiae bacterium]